MKTVANCSAVSALRGMGESLVLTVGKRTLTTLQTKEVSLLIANEAELERNVCVYVCRGERDKGARCEMY